MPRWGRKIVAAIGWALALGCGGDPPGAGGPAQPDTPAIRSLAVAPPESQIEAGFDRKTDVRFRAVAVLSDGTTAEVPADWRTDLPEAGPIDGCGLFHVGGGSGGLVTVTARAEGATATALLGIKLVQDFDLSGASGVREAFASERPRVDSALVAFDPPIQGIRFGHGAEIVLAWRDSGHAYYRVRFHSAPCDVSVYTTDTRLVLSDELRRAVAFSNAGRRVSVALEASDGLEGAVEIPVTPSSVTFCIPRELCNGLDDDCDGRVDYACESQSDFPFEVHDADCR